MRKNPFHKEAATEEMKIYVQNGGLIFLWPFLEELFKARGLLQEGAFINETTLSNAIHTMEYMVTGRLYTPEVVLALNKLLCGLAHDEVVSSRYILRKEDTSKGKVEEGRPGASTAAALQEAEEKDNVVATKTDASQEQATDEQRPIAEKQWLEKGSTAKTEKKLPKEIIELQKACTQAIERVMEQWESLEELKDFKEYEAGLTVQEFRSYILRRPGILRKLKEGNKHYWHLSLAIKTYDTKELKPPWRIERVNLPWMKEQLVVFWIPG